VPSVVHHRAAYVHVCNVWLENAQLAGAFEEDSTASSASAAERYPANWRTLLAKLSTYFIDNRRHIDSDQRRVFWIVCARLHFVVWHKQPAPLAVHRANLLRRLQLRVSVNPIHTYSMRELWAALLSLVRLWNVLPFDRELVSYVTALATRCGQFHWICGTDAGVFDAPLFIEETSADAGRTVFSINERFTVETEIVFSALFRDIGARVRLVRAATELREQPPLATPVVGVEASGDAATGTNERHKEEEIDIFADPPSEEEAVAEEIEPDPAPAVPPIMMNDVLIWVQTAIDKPMLRELLIKDLRNSIYERRVFVGEKERFRSMKQYRFIDPSPFNIVSRMRPREIAPIQDMLDTPNILANLVKRVGQSSAERTTGDPVSDTYADSDAEDVVLTAAAYILDGAFSTGDVRFRTFFVIDERAAVRRTLAANAYPVIVKCFHQYHVLDAAGCMRMCPNVATAIAVWLELLVEDPVAFKAVRRFVATPQALYDAYTSISSGRICVAQRLDREQLEHEARGAAADFPMPEGYDH